MKHTLSLNYHARAMAMSLLVLTLALGLVWAGQWLKGYSEPKVVVREISLATPPPPPPFEGAGLVRAVRIASATG